MKKLIITSQCALFILLATYNASAQNVPEAKPIKAEDASKLSGKNSTVTDNSKLVKPVVVLPLQKKEAPTVVVVKEPVVPAPTEQKTFESRPNPSKGVATQNIEVPKTSTLTGLKNGDPIQLPVQPAKEAQLLKQKE